MACKYIYKGTTYTKEEFESFVKEEFVKKSPENKFLSLLEKDSNLATFFVKSIIQDSAKKGYEKVLFPKGETAAKIEGHETIADEINKIDKELKNNRDFLENPTNLYEVTPFDSNYTDAMLEDGLENKLKKAEKNIVRLEKQKQELKSQGIEKLKPIEAFYEIKVGNILEKQFGKENVKQVTDEYGNTWNEIRITPDLNTKVFIQQQEEEFLPQDPKIEGAVKGIMSQLGIRLEVYDEYAQWYEMTYGKPLHAVGIADMLRGVIAVDKGRADKYTSLEELSHFILYALKDDKRVIDALSVIESTTEWKNHSEAYIEEYDGDMEMVRLEILGKILKKRLGDEILDERPIWKRRLELIWNAFLQFFKKSNPAKELRIENALNDIVNQVMRGDTGQIKEGIQEGKGIFMQKPSSKKAKKPKDDKYEEFRKKFENSKLLNALLGNELDSSMKLIYNRVQDVKRQGIESLIEREQKIYGEMLEDYNKKRVTSGIVKYIAHVEEGSDHILKEINRLRNDYAAGELDGDTIGFIEVLRDMNRYISMYEDSIVSLTTQVAIHKATIDREGNPSEQVDLIMRSLQNIRSGMDAMQQTYKDYAGILLLDHAKGLIMRDPFFRTEEERNAKLADIEANIKSTHNDMWTISMWVNSAAESADDIIGLMDRTHKNAEGAANLQTEDDAKTIINFHEVARENGMLNTEWMYELDENGVPTGNYISEINASKVEKTINEFFTNLRKRFELTPDPVDLNDTKGKQLAHNKRVKERDLMARNELNRFAAYNKAIAKFFSENFEENPKWQSILEAKEAAVYNKVLLLKRDKEKVKQLKAQYGNQWQSKLKEMDIDLAKKVKRAEILLNDWKSERMVETILGNKTVISYRREFAKPKVSKFGNDTFVNLMKDPVRKAYYDAWVAMRDKKVSHMSAEYRNSTLMPQIRKDDLERMRTNPSQVLSQMVKDAFTVRADETERGVLGLDANGRKIQQVPLFFMRKLEDMGELSLDATASMIAFADTANRHSALSAIIDVSEMTADILRVRKIKKEGSEEVITEGGNPYRMYREVMDMRLYGEWKKEELLGTVDMGKVADALNRYSALSTLALNAFAGFNNVILGNSLIRQESFANQHVGIDDVMYADKVYWDPKEGVPNLMQDIGKLRTENKLRLFIERFDLLQDHDNRMSRVNADRGRFGRMFTLSALFFINHMGEHQMQSRLGVALAHKLKVLNDKGEQIPLYEAFDVEDHKLKLKDGIRNLDGSDFTNEDITAFSIRAASINQSLHGIYNSADKAIYQRYAMGRIVGLYRKWMMPGINRRWKGRYHNWSMETDVEGFYRTASKFIYQLFKELREGQFTMASAKDRYSKLHDFEKANLARALGEVAMMMIALVAGILLERLADSIDDDDEIAAWGANMAAYQANRYFTEMAFYLPLLGTLEQLKIINSPAAAVNQISHIMSIGKIIDPTGWLIDDEDFIPRYERGRHKGDLKAYIWARDMFPVVSTVEDWFYPEDRLKYFID
jgi:hypothetical protein